MDSTFLLVFFPAVMLPLGIVIYRILNGELFTILTFYSGIYLFECLGGVVALSIGLRIETRELLSSRQLIEPVAVYFIGYVVFLAGYFAVWGWYVARRPRSIRSWQYRHSAPPRYILSNPAWLFLLMGLTITVSLMFVQLHERIQAAGSLGGYIVSMYSFRSGTLAEDPTENAFVVLANLTGGLSLPLVSVGLLVVWKARKAMLRKAALYGFLVLILFHGLASTFRSTLFFSVVALFGVYSHVRLFRLSTLIKSFVALLGLLAVLNFYHSFMYFATAGWDYTGFAASLAKLIAPHGHLETLCSVLSAAGHSAFLHGQTLLESIFFFVPRFLWPGKSDLYGTTIIQIWAGLPDWYQMAPTNVGELIAHFGYLGVCGMVIHGAIHGFLEILRFRSLAMQAAFYCLVLPRLLAHLGMGVSALAITLFQLGLFYMLTWAIEYRRLSVPKGQLQEARDAV